MLVICVQENDQGYRYFRSTRSTRSSRSGRPISGDSRATFPTFPPRITPRSWRSSWRPSATFRDWRRTSRMAATTTSMNPSWPHWWMKPPVLQQQLQLQRHLLQQLQPQQQQQLKLTRSDFLHQSATPDWFCFWSKKLTNSENDLF